MKRFILTAFFSTFLIVLHAQNYCIKNRFSSTPLFTDAQIQKDSNIVFAVAKHWNSNVMDSLRLDIYYPSASVETLPKRPLIVFAFGGGFLEGSRFDFNYMCKEFAKRGYVAATIDYRIGWNCLNGTAALLCACNDNVSMLSATYRAAQDFNASLRFLSFKSAQYKIDTNFVFVSGGSAGSITAMNAAFLNQAEADQKITWAHAQLGALDSSGNTHPKQYKIKGVLDFCGAVFDTALMTNNADIPVVSFHDSVDCVVPAYHNSVINCTGNCYNLFAVDGSALIYRKALKSGTCAELHINPGTAHCGTNQNYVLTHGTCFLKRVMCNSCTPARYKASAGVASCDSLGFNSGISNQGKSKGFLFYPNPAKDKINFEFTNNENPIQFLLYDMNGKELINQIITGNKFTLPVQNFPSGIYLVRIQSEDGVFSEKVVVE